MSKMKSLPFKRNISARVVDNHLMLRINLSKDYGTSKSGKSNIIASTLGITKVPGTDVSLGVNVFRKNAA